MPIHSAIFPLHHAEHQACDESQPREPQIGRGEGGGEIDISAARAFKEYGPDSSTCKEAVLSGGFYLLTRACMQKKRLGERGLGGACCSRLILSTFAYSVCKIETESGACHPTVRPRCVARCCELLGSQRLIPQHKLVTETWADTGTAI